MAVVAAWLVASFAGALAAAGAVFLAGCGHLAGEVARQRRRTAAEVAQRRCAEGVTDTSGDIADAARELLTTLHAMGDFGDEVLAGARRSQELTSRSVTSAADVQSGVALASESAASVSENVLLVVAALDPLKKNLGVVSEGARQTVDVTHGAAQQSADCDSKMADLTTAAQEIGQVVGTISDIAEQTNLLALNATIEAARAGEAGKGFAVVASEVKELARQTSEATRDISSRVEAIQASSSQAVESTRATREAVAQVESAAESIAESVARQQGTVSDIHSRLDVAQNDMEGLSSALADITRAGDQVAEGLGDAERHVRESTQNVILTRQIDEDLHAAMAKVQGVLPA